MALCNGLFNVHSFPLTASTPQALTSTRLFISSPKQNYFQTPLFHPGNNNTLVGIFLLFSNCKNTNQKNLIIKAWKNNSRELLKANFFCYQKRQQKVDKLCMKFSSTLNTSVQQVLQNPWSLILLPPLF